MNLCSKRVQQRLALYQGVCPLYMKFSDDAEKTFSDALTFLQVIHFSLVIGVHHAFPIHMFLLLVRINLWRRQSMSNFQYSFHHITCQSSLFWMFQHFPSSMLKDSCVRSVPIGKNSVT